MSAFSKLMEEFAAATGVDTVVDAKESCTLEADGLVMTIQYLPGRDEVVLFSPVWTPEMEGERPSAAAMRAALELEYDGQGTGGAFLGLFQEALVLSVHLPFQGLDAGTLAVRLMGFADAAAGAAAELAAAASRGEAPSGGAGAAGDGAGPMQDLLRV